MNNSRYPYPLIAREGWPHLAIVAAASLVAWWLGGWAWSWPFWGATAFVLQFFRDPARTVSQDPGVALSAADGRVVAVEAAEDPYLKRGALKISVFMNVFNVHSNRAPVDGEVKGRWYNPGKFVNADLDKASEDNERQHFLVERADGVKIGFTQIAGLVARRIVPFSKVGDTVTAGERVGLIRFGSRVDVYFPQGTAPKVALGQRCVAGETILGVIGDSAAAVAITQ